MAKGKYWGGFCNNRLCDTLEHFGSHDKILAIYVRKKDAKKHYQDVRPVEIKEIKNSKELYYVKEDCNQDQI